MKEVVINNCYGGFSLSDEAYEELIRLGVPVIKYTPEERGENGLYKPQPLNDGEVIFDRTLADENDELGGMKYFSIMGRYWETWIGENRGHPLLIKVVKKLKDRANGKCAELKIVKIPDDVKYTIEEYDGLETIAEEHRSWN